MQGKMKMLLSSTPAMNMRKISKVGSLPMARTEIDDIKGELADLTEAEQQATKGGALEVAASVQSVATSSSDLAQTAPISSTGTSGRIRDVTAAANTSQQTHAAVRAQAAASLLAQANQTPPIAGKLLR
jgi:flagellin-like hook-associated protein FlgL